MCGTQMNTIAFDYFKFGLVRKIFNKITFHLGLSVKYKLLFVFTGHTPPFIKLRE